MTKMEELKEAVKLLKEIQYRSWIVPENLTIVKMKKILRDKIDEFFEKYPYDEDYGDLDE